jgi:hypothetical protein
MKKIIPILIIMLFVSACTSDFKANEQIVDILKKKFKPVSVSVSDGVEANANSFNGSKKEIVIDMGEKAAMSKALMLDIAYHSADTAYQLISSHKDKLPSFFQVRVKADGITSDNMNYKTTLMANNQLIIDKIKTFMQAVVQRRYNELPNYIEPELNLTPIITLLKGADANGSGVSSYQFVGLQHARGFHNPDKKPMDVIQGWVMLSATGTKAQYPMLFIVNPASNQLSSVYINPK